MTGHKKDQPQDPRAERRAEALRRNLQRRKLQARGRAVAENERGDPDRPGPDTQKQDR